MNPFRFLKPRRRIEVVKRAQSTLRLHEWRAEKALVSAAMQILRHQDMQMMLDVLRNEHPGTATVIADLALDKRAILQAQAEGYTMALANLEALGRFEQSAEPLEPTFEAEEINPAEL